MNEWKPLEVDMVTRVMLRQKIYHGVPGRKTNYIKHFRRYLYER